MKNVTHPSDMQNRSIDDSTRKTRELESMSVTLRRSPSFFSFSLSFFFSFFVFFCTVSHFSAVRHHQSRTEESAARLMVFPSKEIGRLPLDGISKSAISFFSANAAAVAVIYRYSAI
jgi:hypothetical protein